jgi:hypothetical protein
LVAPNTFLIILFTDYLIDRSDAVWFILGQCLFKLVIKLINFGLHLDDWIDVLLSDTPVLSNSLLSKKHHKNGLVLSLNKSNRDHWSVVVEEVEQKHFHDEGVIVILLVLMVFIVGNFLSQLHVGFSKLDD